MFFINLKNKINNYFMKSWPLAVPSLTILDKLKVAKFLLTSDKLTAGPEVRRYEQMWEAYTGAPHAIMVSSGSTANELIAMKRKEELVGQNRWPHCNRVIFPVVTWPSSVTPWLKLGFEPIFMDVRENMCSNYQDVNLAMMHDKNRIAAVFYTTLLGFSGGIDQIKICCDYNGIPVYLDNCESSFSYDTFTDRGYRHKRHVCNIGISSTSIFFSHHTSGDQEGGLVFCHSEKDADWFRMARSHGMTRGMGDCYKNPEVDPMFDFYLKGTNYRSTDLLAYMASLTFKRSLAFAPERCRLSKLFSELLAESKYYKPHGSQDNFVPLALPIVSKTKDRAIKVRGCLTALNVEHRPIIGGNLVRHTAFREFGNHGKFPKADLVHDNGVYVGLHRGVSDDMIFRLTDRLNRL